MLGMKQSARNVERQGESRETGKSRRIITVVGALGLVGIITGAIHLIEQENKLQPDFLIEGVIEDDGKNVQLVGGVTLDCAEVGVQPAQVNASVRLITDRLHDQSGARGRIVKVQVTPGASNCDEALNTVSGNPEKIIAGVVDNVTGVVPNVVGDGTYAPADVYEEIFKDARGYGVPVIPIEQK